jgi:hypothetical protein
MARRNKLRCSVRVSGAFLLLVACGNGGAHEAGEDAIRGEPRVRAPGILAVTEGARALVPEARPEPSADIRSPRDECEPGQRVDCSYLLPPRRDGSHFPTVVGLCKRGNDKIWRKVCEGTPIVVVFGSERVQFTRPQGNFAIGGFARTEWVSARTPWLARDLDDSGCIEDQRELFGVAPGDAFKNGFEKLALLDANGDGFVDVQDPGFAGLFLWADKDQNRVCDQAEVRTLRSTGILGLSVRPMNAAPSTRAESYEGETTAFEFTIPGRRRNPKTRWTIPGRLVDVYLTALH